MSAKHASLFKITTVKTSLPNVPVVAAVACAAARLLVDFIVPDMVPRRDCRISNVAYPFSSMLAASSSRCCFAWSENLPEIVQDLKKKICWQRWHTW
jgi:hypothetical protein